MPSPGAAKGTRAAATPPSREAPRHPPQRGWRVHRRANSGTRARHARHGKGWRGGTTGLGATLRRAAFRAPVGTFRRPFGHPFRCHSPWAREHSSVHALSAAHLGAAAAERWQQNVR